MSLPPSPGLKPLLFWFAAFCGFVLGGCAHITITECHVTAEIQIGHMLRQPQDSPIGILLLEADVISQRALLEVTNATEGTVLRGWVRTSEYASFSAAWTGVEGLKVVTVSTNAVVVERAYSQ